MREPFPLQWPDGWKRTPADRRQRSSFGFRNQGQVQFAAARNDLLAELERLGAANVVLTSDLPTRGDGMPYANGRADDPGIAVWFVLHDAERVFACDKWKSHAENMKAIAKSIEALRGLERWGASDVVTRAFSGFNALPPGGDSEYEGGRVITKKPWREVIGGTWPQLERAELLVLARARHRVAIKNVHPDAGGSHELAAELNAALAEAEIELGDDR